MPRRPGRRCRVGLLLWVALLAPAGAGGGMLPGARNDGVVDLHVGGRDLILGTDGAAIDGFLLTSRAGLLAGEGYAEALGVFTTDEDSLIADQLGYALDGVHDLGRALGEATALEQLQADLTLTYTLAGQAGVFSAGILPALPGDADVDGDVDRDDFLSMSAGFGQPGAVWTGGDFNGTGEVDCLDYLAWKAGAAGGGGTPEPATGLLLFLSAAAALGRPRGPRGRRRRP